MTKPNPTGPMPPKPPSVAPGPDNEDRHPQTDKPHRKTRTKSPQGHDGYEWASLVFSFLAFVAAAVAASAAIWLAIETQTVIHDARATGDTTHADQVNFENLAATSADIQHGQTEAALKLAQINTSLTTEQINLAAKALIAANRASIAVRGIQVDVASSNPAVPPFGDGEFTYWARPIIENIGHSPAFDVRAVVNRQPFTKGAYATGDFKGGPNNTCDLLKAIKGGTTIYPGASIGPMSGSLFFSRPMHPKDWLIVLQGCITYRTTDGPHKSRFCYILNPYPPGVFGYQIPVEKRPPEPCSDGSDSD